MKFPFKDSDDVAVFTCCHIIEDGADICYVSHDEDDGAWQFICENDNHEDFEGRIISLKQAFEMDNSIGELADLPLGFEAVRDSKNLPWK